MTSYPLAERSSPKNRSHTRLFGLLLALALIAAACSQTPEEQAAPPPGEPSTTTTATTTTTTPATTTTLGLSEFAGAEVTVLVQTNPTMDAIQELTPEFFTEPTGIEVTFTNLEDFNNSVENTVRTDLSFGDFSVIMMDAFDTTQLGNVRGDSIVDLSFRFGSLGGDELPPSALDADYIPPVLQANSIGDAVYAVPFSAESSIIMYNQQIIDGNGITFPEAPTWQQVADIARAVDTNETTGICSNGIPEWDQFAALHTTVVNTFGGTWWEAIDSAGTPVGSTEPEANVISTPGQPQINQPDSGFRAATEFYVDLITDAGPDNFSTTGFDECLEQFQNGNVAIWYGSTAAPPLLEATSSPIAGNVGYARAPTAETDASGSLSTFGLGLPTARGPAPPLAAWDFVRWATSPDILQLIAENSTDGWRDPAIVGAAVRLSDFEIPELREATAPFIDVVFDEINATNPNNPGTTPRPGLPGVQFVSTPGFRELGDLCSAEISTAIEGQISVDDALDNCQRVAAEISIDQNLVSVPPLFRSDLPTAQMLLESIGLTSSHTFVDQDGNPISESEAAGALVIYQELPHRRLVLPGREIQLTLQVPE